MDFNRLRQYAEKVRQQSEDLDHRIFAKVVGVTFDGRQQVLEQMSRKTPITLQRDRRNVFDSYAVKVMVELNGEWVEVGFIPRQMNRKICRALDNGAQVSAQVHRIVGGVYSEYANETLNYGLEICINPER